MLVCAWSRYAIALLALAPAAALAAPIESQPAEVNGTPTATSRLWVTLDRTLEGGTNHIILVSSDEVPTDDGGSSGTDSGADGNDTEVCAPSTVWASGAAAPAGAPAPSDGVTTNDVGASPAGATHDTSTSPPTATLAPRLTASCSRPAMRWVWRWLMTRVRSGLLRCASAVAP